VGVTCAQCFTVHIEQCVRVFRAGIIRLDTAVDTVIAQYSSCLILEQQNDSVRVIKCHLVKMNGDGGVAPRIIKPGS